MLIEVLGYSLMKSLAIYFQMPSLHCHWFGGFNEHIHCLDIHILSLLISVFHRHYSKATLSKQFQALSSYFINACDQNQGM